MLKHILADRYRGYIDCLNRQDWANLGEFVHADVRHNGRLLGVVGYQQMLENDFSTIPDLHFNIGLLMCDPPCIAARLEFDCSPSGEFLGLVVDGKRLYFTENVFYEFRDGMVWKVWSIVDKGAIEAQM